MRARSEKSVQSGSTWRPVRANTPGRMHLTPFLLPLALSLCALSFYIFRHATRGIFGGFPRDFRDRNGVSAPSILTATRRRSPCVCTLALFLPSRPPISAKALPVLASPAPRVLFGHAIRIPGLLQALLLLSVTPERGGAPSVLTRGGVQQATVSSMRARPVHVQLRC